MGYVKRKATSKAKDNVEDLASLKRQYLLDIRGIVEMEEIPQDLILNWDQTAVNYVPVSNWTMAKEGTHKVAIAGIDDKANYPGASCIHDRKAIALTVSVSG